MNTPLLEKFTNEYERLNPEQQKAVDAIEGPVMVIAGPGTGKTQILAMRIANILLKTDTRPDNILALTFTEAGVAAMRRRLIGLIGSTGYAVNVFTFHSFCNDVLRAYGDDIPEHIGKTDISELEQVRIVEDVLQTVKDISQLRPFGNPLYFLRSILARINEFKRDGVSPEKLEEILTAEAAAFENTDGKFHEKGAHVGKMKGVYRDWEKEIAKNRELHTIYAAYQERLAAARQYDYNDMILFVVRALETNEDLLLRLQERYQYVLVDEHQDTNPGQNRVVELLGSFHSTPNIFVVGDDRQAIYAFQGASRENFMEFAAAHPSAHVVTLNQNYRSVQQILDAAHHLTRHETLADARTEAETALRASRESTDARTIELAEYATADEERHAIAASAERLIAEGVPAEELAVIYRENREAAAIAAALEQRGIPYVIESNKDLFEDADIRKLYRLFRAVATLASEDIGMLLLLDISGIPVADAHAVFQEHHRTGRSVIEVISGEGAPSSARVFAKKFSSWVDIAASDGAEKAGIAILNDSGLLAALAKKADAAQKLQRLHILFKKLRAMTAAAPNLSLAEFVERLESIQVHGVPIREPRMSGAVRAVRCMTAHGAKGLEFDYVFIVNAVDGVWGGRRALDLIRLPRFYYGERTGAAPLARGDEEEARLFYVAFTRARRGVRISHATLADDGRERILSRFAEHVDKLGVRVPHTPRPEATRMFTQPDSQIRAANLRATGVALLQEIFRRRGVSATALNNYLACPWRYVFSSLLRIPREMSEQQEYGTAVHGALHALFDALAESKSATSELLTDIFVKEAMRRHLSERWIERGRMHLAAYYDEYNGTWNPKTANELSIRALLPAFDIPGLVDGIPITGKLDKVEIISVTGNTAEVNVVDYKTGAPKSRNAIEGKTHSATGDYKRQIVFYNLLLDQAPGAVAPYRAARMISGEIDFVEPNKNGKFQKEPFDVSKEEKESVAESIRELARLVMDPHPSIVGCGKKECEYCALGVESGLF